MGCYETSDGVDAAIARLAGRQYGVVSRAQLVALGASSRQIQRRVAASRLLAVHRCVFAVGHGAPRREARWMAAVLASGAGAVVGHRSAAALWALIEREREFPDVTAPTRRRTHGVAVHRGRLEDEDKAIHQRIPITSPARTLADLAHTLTTDDLTRAVREAQFRRLLHLPSVLAVLERRPARRLRELVADLTSRGSTAPSMQTPRPPHAEDATTACWSPRRLPLATRRVVVEADGYEAHATPAAFQLDRSTTNRLQLDGYTILRFTHADITRRPVDVAEQIRDALAL